MSNTGNIGNMVNWSCPVYWRKMHPFSQSCDSLSCDSDINTQWPWRCDQLSLWHWWCVKSLKCREGPWRQTRSTGRLPSTISQRCSLSLVKYHTHPNAINIWNNASKCQRFNANSTWTPLPTYNLRHFMLHKAYPRDFNILIIPVWFINVTDSCIISMVWHGIRRFI